MKRLLLILALLFAGLGSQADEPETPILGNLLRFSLTPAGAGARAAGMANAFTAIADDGTAASWNPAGLAQLEKPEFSVVYAASDQSMHNSAAQNPSLAATYSPFSMSYRRGSPDFTSMAFPFRLAGKPVTFQVSWQRAYRLWFHAPATVTESLSTGPAFLIHSQTDLDGSIGMTSVAGGIRLTERTLVGVSVNWWSGDWSIGSSMVDTPITGTGGPQFLNFVQGNHISGCNYNLGLLLLYPRFSVGLVYRSSFHADYHFTTSLTSNLPNGFQGSQAFSTRLRFPRQVSAGLAWKPSDTWTVDLDLTQVQWSKMEIEGVPNVFPALNFLDFQPTGATTTRDTLSASLGAEYLHLTAHGVIPIRFGVGYDPQGGRDPYFGGPVNYYLLSAGTGYNTNTWKFDAAVQYRRASFRSGSYLEPQSVNQTPRIPDAVGSVQGREWRVYCSVICRITDPKAIQRFFHKAFVGP
ncbi:MAG: OmpP1/FadL family transporter [Acidobacteriota bacterium]